MAFVTWTDNALEDVEAICFYIARNSPGAAEVFADSLFAASRQLEQFPRMGRRVPEVLHGEVRELILGNYRLAYRIVGDEVQVLTVYHSARRPGSTDLG